MGFEGVEVRSAEDYRPLNALEDGQELPDTMPVYRNPSWLSRPNLDAMEARLWEVAALFGVTEGEIVRTDNTPPDEELEQIIKGIEEKGFPVSDQMFSGSVKLEADGLSFYAAKSGAVRVTMKPGTLTYGDAPFDPDETAQSLLASMSDRLGLQDPEAVVIGGNRDIYDNVKYEILFAEHAETAAARARRTQPEHGRVRVLPQRGKRIRHRLVQCVRPVGETGRLSHHHAGRGARAAGKRKLHHHSPRFAAVGRRRARGGAGLPCAE